MAMSAISYVELLSEARQPGATVASYLRAELPYIWQDAYLAGSDRPTNILLFTYGSFDYLYDAYQQLEPYDTGSGLIPVEARLVAAIGHAEPKRIRRDDGRLRGMALSSMPETSGPCDRGHFMVSRRRFNTPAASAFRESMAPISSRSSYSKPNTRATTMGSNIAGTVGTVFQSNFRCDQTSNWTREPRLRSWISTYAAALQQAASPPLSDTISGVGALRKRYR